MFGQTPGPARVPKRKSRVAPEQDKRVCEGGRFVEELRDKTGYTPEGQGRHGCFEDQFPYPDRIGGTG